MGRAFSAGESMASAARGDLTGEMSGDHGVRLQGGHESELMKSALNEKRMRVKNRLSEIDFCGPVRAFSR